MFLLVTCLVAAAYALPMPKPELPAAPILPEHVPYLVAYSNPALRTNFFLSPELVYEPKHDDKHNKDYKKLVLVSGIPEAHVLDSLNPSLRTVSVVRSSMDEGKETEPPKEEKVTVEEHPADPEEEAEESDPAPVDESDDPIEEPAEPIEEPAEPAADPAPPKEPVPEVETPKVPIPSIIKLEIQKPSMLPSWMPWHGSFSLPSSLSSFSLPSMSSISLPSWTNINVPVQSITSIFNRPQRIVAPYRNPYLVVRKVAE